MKLDYINRLDMLDRLVSLFMPHWMHNRLSILIYHRIRRDSDELLPNSIDAATFDWQVALVRRYFNILPLYEAVRCLRADKLPPRALAITFDDGYADDVEVVLPILLRYGAPATFFIASGYLDGGRMWNDTVIETLRYLPDQELDLQHWGLGCFRIRTLEERGRVVDKLIHYLKRLDLEEREQRLDELSKPVRHRLDTRLMMRSDQVRSLHQAGMEIGSHTVSHPILISRDDETVRREITQGRTTLEDMIEAPVRCFAYPNGRPGLDFRLKHVEVVRKAGFEAAVTTAWGVATPHSDLWQLPRFTPWDRTPERFLLRLLHHRGRTSPVVAN